MSFLWRRAPQLPASFVCQSLNAVEYSSHKKIGR
jgi:hypothetical protein